MKRTATQKMVITGLMVATGLLLPFVTAHAFAVPGTILLPMHIPVLLCAVLCGPKHGALCGAVVPLLSSAVTGMPPMYPMLPIMAAQLFVLGFTCGFLCERARFRAKWYIYPALIIAIAAGWVCYGLVYTALLFSTGGALSALSVTAAMAQGLPGMAVQLVLIPVLAAAVNRSGKKKRDAALAEASAIIKSKRASFVVMREGKVVHMDEGRGVSPLLRCYENTPELLLGCFAADKIIGKAAAMVLVLGKAGRVYGEIMSVAAWEYLRGRGIPASYGRCVDVITARDKKGICPIEQSVLAIDDPHEGLKKLKQTIVEMMKQAG